MFLFNEKLPFIKENFTITFYVKDKEDNACVTSKVKNITTNPHVIN